VTFLGTTFGESRKTSINTPVQVYGYFSFLSLLLASILRLILFFHSFLRLLILFHFILPIFFLFGSREKSSCKKAEFSKPRA
jgi:hypothetical protein